MVTWFILLLQHRQEIDDKRFIYQRVQIEKSALKPVQLQQKNRYQTPNNLPVCENNHNRPNLASIGPYMVPWA